MGGREAWVRVLVTGGGGFLGFAVARQLRARGDQVRSLARGSYPELAEHGIEEVRADLADAQGVSDAVAGCDAVIHTAAKAGDFGPYAEYHAANVEGTANVLAACREHGVDRLVHTSTPSVVHGGGDVEGVDESAPYPDHFDAAYPETKAIAERMVLEANGPDLATVALRPHLIWGPGDHHLVPKIISRARAGRLRRIGNEPRLIDVVYIDNAADAHLLALDRLTPGSACAGKAYFISQGEPVPNWEMIDRILAAGGEPPCTRTISAGMASFAGGVLELAFRVLPLGDEPPMTRFAAHQLSTAHWYDISAARRDLGFEPRVSIDEGLERLAAHLREFPVD
jgi:nucleoside-diphosphate-sugar epimerase